MGITLRNGVDEMEMKNSRQNGKLPKNVDKRVLINSLFLFIHKSIMLWYALEAFC